MAKDQEIIDFGWEKYLEELNDDFSYVDVGVVAKDGAQKVEDGLTLAELAHIQEFGVKITVTPKMKGFLGATGMQLKKETKEITIPPRSAIRGTFDENEAGLSRLVSEQEKEIQAGRQTKKRALTMIGQTHQNQIQKAMSTSGKFAPNHPYTIEKKGSSQPLIGESGRYRQSINFEVG
jgi:hypothetical protein